MDELSIKTHIIDYKTVYKGGVIISVGINIYDYCFNAILWIHKEEPSVLECSSDFLKLFGYHTHGKSTADLPFYNELIYDIESLLDKEKIFNEFNI